MEAFYRLPFLVLQCPRLKLKRPSFITYPPPMLVFAIVLISYFLITGGVVYDMIVGPPSIGTETDERGNRRPVAILVWRLNGQFILEGLAASFMFVMGSVGFILMDKINEGKFAKLNRVMLMTVGAVCIMVSLFTLNIFINIKLPYVRISY